MAPPRPVPKVRVSGVPAGGGGPLWGPALRSRRATSFSPHRAAADRSDAPCDGPSPGKASPLPDAGSGLTPEGVSGDIGSDELFDIAASAAPRPYSRQGVGPLAFQGLTAAAVVS